MTEPKPPFEPPEKTYWLDDMRNVDKIFYGLVTLCALLFLTDLLYHKHTNFPIESWFGFYAWYGFVCCTLLVLLAKQMRKVVMRPEDYYDEPSDREADRPSNGHEG